MTSQPAIDGACLGTGCPRLLGGGGGLRRASPLRRLPEAVKRRLVEHLACYRTHAEVVELIAEEFNITLARRHVRAYDPDAFQFAASRRWLDYHRLVRKRFAQVMGEIPIAHRAVRLRRLDAIFEKAMRADDLLEARAALEQAAKEMGGVFTNVSKSAGVVAHDATGIDDLSPEERRNMLADRLSQAAERIPVAMRMSN